MRKKILFIFCFYFHVSVLHAQSVEIQDSTVHEAIVVPDSSIQQTPTLILVTDTLHTIENTPLAVVELPMDSAVAPIVEKNPIKTSGFFAPAALMIYGLTIQGHGGLTPSYGIRQDLQSTFPGFHTPIDDYIQFVPAIAAYATGYISGTNPRHSNGKRLWMFVQAQVLTSVAVAALKHYTNEQRPNGSDYLSFPSGHTAQAFMGAALFDMEYPGQMKGIKIGLYTLAGLTGMLAIMNDRHWANDVLFGAGVGMLSVRLLYWSEQHWKEKNNATMKIFTVEQIKAWDRYTIEHLPISSIDLMEKAAAAFVERLLLLYPEETFLVFSGSGNNGGDGLAIARLLLKKNRQVEVWLLKDKELSPDAKTNCDRLIQAGGQLKTIIGAAAVEESEWLRINAKQQVLIDALLGTGLNRPVTNHYAEFIHRINATQKKIVAVDIPSGLSADAVPQDGQTIIRASETITFQVPKRVFFYEKSFPYTGIWFVVDIGLSPVYERETTTNLHYTLLEDIKEIYKPRSPFANKGNFGKGLLIAGSYGIMGAAVIAARACLRSGIGLLKVYSPTCGLTILQTTIPEAMVLTDPSEKDFSTVPDLQPYSAIAIGPGWHESDQALEVLKTLFTETTVPMVVDAGALNLLSKDQTLWLLIPKGSILTPHKKEFDRLAGKVLTQQEQEETAMQWAKQYQLQFILKGKYSAVVLSDGSIHYNTTGNAGMAKGGSGDCLTGVLLALLAQGYTPHDAAKLGTFIHGYAGDIAAEKYSQEAMMPTDLIESIGDFFKVVRF